MRILLNIIFFIGAAGTIAKYAGVDFFVENSLIFLIMFAGSAIVSIYLRTKEASAQSKN
ncbi:hypothetical protein M4D55_17035 [Metabacillus idriensis]|uniref:hypothetical protein n=1 Tax=Metabacillus idriensis TaxID=324768 RepID=UPI00203EF7A9|nr:hypothetical protein [Metabacillus idriensis]MCM3597478.1 hypothetical protein [Metabacillus idriensis]